MSVKRDVLRAKKQAKRKQQSKAKAKQRTLERVKADQMMNQLNKDKGGYAAQHGLSDAIDHFRHAKNKDTVEETIDNKWVMEFITTAIPQFVKIHSGAEVISRLVGEKKLTLDSTQQRLIKELDQAVVSFTEDIDAISSLVEAGKEPSDYIEVLFHLTDSVGTAVSSLFGDVIQMVLSPFEYLLNQFVTEHKPEDMELYSYMMILHEDRMKDVANLYRIKLTQPYEPFEPEIVEAVEETDLANEIFQPKANDDAVDAEVIPVQVPGQPPVHIGKTVLLGADGQPATREELIEAGFVEQ